MKFDRYKVKADAYCPELKPKSNPEDMKKIKELYSDLEERLKGIEPTFDKCGVEKFVITFVKKGGIADEPED